MANLKNLYFMFSLYFSLCVPFQVDRGPARKGVHIPNTRSENLKENSFSVCTLTRKNACSFLGCLTSPTAKWRFGFRTVAWRRRNWTEIGCNITRQILCFRGENSTALSQFWRGTHSVCRLSVYVVYHSGSNSSINTANGFHFKFEDNNMSREVLHELSGLYFHYQTGWGNLWNKHIFVHVKTAPGLCKCYWGSKDAVFSKEKKEKNKTKQQTRSDWLSVFCNQKAYMISFVLF